MRNFLRNRSFLAFACLLIACVAAGPRISVGTTVATDTAADPEYWSEPTGAWKGLNSTQGENPPGSDNGGVGFDTWNFAGGYHDPTISPYGNLNHFIDGVDYPASSFNDLASPAFGLTNANRPFFGYTSRATRTFAPLQVGDTLSIDFDNPLLQPLDPFSASGFLFRLNTGGGPIINNNPIPGVDERFGVFTTSNFNSARWYTTDSEDFTDTGVADSVTASGGATFRFTLTDTESYTAEFVRLDDGEVLFSRTSELNNKGTGGIDTLEITLFGNGSGSGFEGSATGQREFFFNNLQIVGGAQNSTLGDFNDDGTVSAADYTVWRDSFGASDSVLPAGSTDDTSILVDSDDYITWKVNFESSAQIGRHGDYNNDRIISSADYVVWRDNLGASDTVLPAYSTNDGSGFVDANDFAVWKENFGQSYVSTAKLSGSLAVPEPSTLVLILGLITLSYRLRGCY